MGARKRGGRGGAIEKREIVEFVRERNRRERRVRREDTGAEEEEDWQGKEERERENKLGREH